MVGGIGDSLIVFERARRSEIHGHSIKCNVLDIDGQQSIRMCLEMTLSDLPFCKELLFNFIIDGCHATPKRKDRNNS